MAAGTSASLDVASSSKAAASQDISTGSSIGGNQLNLGSGTISDGSGFSLPTWAYYVIVAIIVVIIYFIFRS